MTTGVSISGLSTDLKTGLAFLTRLPLVPSAPVTGAELVRASWTFPIVGAGVGAFGALIYWLMHALGLHAFVGAVLAVAGTALITGCLHEDGLADTADGFGAGGTPERKLEIMRDSQIGTYGAAALILSLLLRVGAIASLADPALAALALIAAHAGARAHTAGLHAARAKGAARRTLGRCRRAATEKLRLGGRDRPCCALGYASVSAPPSSPSCCS